MKDRSIIELLKLLDKKIDGPLFYSGLCLLIRRLLLLNIITSSEERVLHDYITKYKPDDAYKYQPYWWPMGERKLRHEFLQKLIKKEERWKRLLQVLKFWSSWGH